jgi:hypothetical protein
VFRPIAKGERIQGARLSDGSIASIVKAHAAPVSGSIQRPLPSFAALEAF